MREMRLITDGSICQDAHSYQDPNIMTVADARAKGRQNCPLFEPCQKGDLRQRKHLICSAFVGMEMARYIATEGTTLEQEIAGLKESPILASGNNSGFIDPYSDEPLKSTTDPEEVETLVTKWANTILYGPKIEAS